MQRLFLANRISSFPASAEIKEEIPLFGMLFKYRNIKIVTNLSSPNEILDN